MSFNELYGVVALDEIHRNGSIPNHGFVNSSAESVSAEVESQTLVGSPTTLPPPKLNIGLNRVQKIILAILTIAIFGLIVVTAVMLFLLLRQNEDLQLIKEDISRMQLRVVYSLESVDQQAAGDKIESATQTSFIEQQVSSSTKVRNEISNPPLPIKQVTASPGEGQTAADALRGAWKFPLNEYSEGIRKLMLDALYKVTPDDISQMKGNDILDWVELEFSGLLKLEQSVCNFCADHCLSNVVTPPVSTKAVKNKTSVTTPPPAIKTFDLIRTNRNEEAATTTSSVVASVSHDGRILTENFGGTLGTTPDSIVAAPYYPTSTTSLDSRRRETSPAMDQITQQHSTMSSDNAARSQQRNGSTLFTNGETSLFTPFAIARTSQNSSAITNVTQMPSVNIGSDDTTAVDSDIVTGWYPAGNGLSYKLVKANFDYETARSDCKSRGGQLASTGLRNETTRKELYDLSQCLEFWIGLDELKNKSHWVWSDGIESPEKDLPWDVGQPNHAGSRVKQECVEMTNGGKLNDEICQLPQNYLCEKG